MDVNGTRFHLLTSQQDWQALLQGHPTLDWDNRCAALTLKEKAFHFPTLPKTMPLTLKARRGAACDRYGTWYWIGDNAKEIRYLPTGNRTAGQFWAVANLNSSHHKVTKNHDFRPVRTSESVVSPDLQGLAVTRHHYLVVGTLLPAGLLIFDLHAGGPPLWRRWPDGVSFTPYDIAPADDGGIYILDQTQARYWRLDRYFRLIAEDSNSVTLTASSPDDFKPLGGVPRQRPEQRFPLGISLNASAIAIIALPNGSILILDNEPHLNFSRIHHFQAGHKLAEKTIQLKGYDFAFLPHSEQGGELFVVTEHGNQSFVFDLTITGKSLEIKRRPSYLPMRRFSGKGLVAAAGEVYYDFAERWLPLTQQFRPRYNKRATLSGIILDGKSHDCVWHRLCQDAYIPDNTEVIIASRAANQREDLKEQKWQKEPAPYLRHEGSELPFHRPFGDTASSQDGIGTWELLFQNAKGRFLELRLILRGNGRNTPRLRALRVYYPRFSYLERYLPAIYQEDTSSASFLDRFLANLEGLYTTLEGRIERAESLLDPRTAPSEYLNWLAGWFGTVLDPNWDEKRRRLFLTHAEALFRWRGTLRGILAAIHLAVDPCPDARIFEALTGQDEAAPKHFGHNTVRIVEHFLRHDFSDHAHRFTVLVPTVPEETPITRQQCLERVKAIVEREKPAHTDFDIKLFWALFQVGTARLGLDTVLGEGSRYLALVLGSTHLGETVLAESHPWNIADRSIIGRDPLMENINKYERF